MEELLSAIVTIVLFILAINSKRKKAGEKGIDMKELINRPEKPKLRKQEDMKPNIQRKQEISREIVPAESRRTAERWLEGADMIPDGMKVVTCGYCGADNLIGRSIRKEEYSCYFCREEL